MSRFFKRRRSNSTSSQPPQLTFSTDEADRSEEHSESRNSRPNSAIFDRTRSASISGGLSSSFKTPTRSFIHHAGHGTQEPMQYSSSGVREQTAELSSSFLGGTERRNASPRDESPSRRSSFSAEVSTAEQDAGSKSQTRPEIIIESSEPASPEETGHKSPLQSSRLSELLQDSPATEHQDTARAQKNRTRTEPTRSRSEALFDDESQDDEDDDNEQTVTEESPLLPSERLSSVSKKLDDEEPDLEGQAVRRTGTWQKLHHAYPSLRKSVAHTYHIATNPKTWDGRKVAHEVLVRPASMLPAVFLGVLLNLLDALSYGIILFPLGEEVFSKMGPDGVSMFYVSCIVSQIVYSSGSIFRGGVGSEMIEVVPFFHKMTYMVINHMGDGHPDALRATVITSYAMSSILTGVVFFILGSARLGTLVSFFPHSILTGCIGGVGIFLFVTGIEVSARLDGNLEFSREIMAKLFQADTVVLWLPPLVLAILLLTIKHYYDRPWLVPAYYIGITAIFYIVVAAVPQLSLPDLRHKGWVFDSPDAGVPFYNFYSYYKFGLVDWGAIWMTVPTQLALTFFGILHVPINVPNLAMVVQEDNISVNRELIMHGLSNTLSGCLGSIQNYLVFVNSVLFIDTGGDSRLAGYMLAAATFGLWVAGPVVIGYVPVMVVGTLIYMLGIDLASEALVATYGRLHRLEYFTIIVIAFVMGIYDFVAGIAVGIGLACLVYVVQTSRKTVIRAEFSGAVAESTVRRHPRQRQYLHKVGPQIRVVKLGGYLFFGSIVKVEKKVRALIDAEAFAAEPIRYLIVDFSHVTGIDFSAAEAFGRMNRILHRRDVRMNLAGVSLQSDVGNSLQMVGLFVENDDDASAPAPKVYETLNGALEACENELLTILTERQRHELLTAQKAAPSSSIDIPAIIPAPVSASALDAVAGSPRIDLLHQAATTTLKDHKVPDASRWKNFKQPLPLLLQTFQDLTTKNEDFWFKAVSFFERKEYVQGKVLYSRGDRPDGFYILQSGILRAEYDLDQGSYHESIASGTTCGELPFFSETSRTSTVAAELDCVAWLLTQDKWEAMQQREPEVARELLKVGMKLSAERMNAITSYVLITAS